VALFSLLSLEFWKNQFLKEQFTWFGGNPSVPRRIAPLTGLTFKDQINKKDTSIIRFLTLTFFLNFLNLLKIEENSFFIIRLYYNIIFSKTVN